MSSNNNTPPQSGSSDPNAPSGGAPPLFSMNFFVPLNPAASGQPQEGQTSMTWTMHFSTQPPHGHPAAQTSANGSNGIPPIGLHLPPGLPIAPFPPIIPNSTSAPPGGPSGATPAFFPNFALPNFFMRPEPQPDPEKAKELLKSLPSVSRDMIKRINRICDAEEPDSEERGWRCGVCMDGAPEEEEKTGVKVLPCNHLFHEHCLEPWFATKHTCPACRLDLDPLHTMRGSSSQGSGGRAPGRQRAGYHPFRRDAMPVPPSGNPTAPTAGAPQPANPINPDEQVDVETRFSFTFRIPTPPPAGSPGQAPATPTQPLAQPAPENAGLNTPPIFNNLFGQRIHTSPSPMLQPDPTMPSPIPLDRSGSNGATPVATHLHAPRPQRPHVVVHHNHLPPPPGQTPPAFIPPDFHPPMVPPQIIHVFHGPPPERPSAPAPTPKSTFVPKPLDEWIMEREKAMGWRHDCDAPECDYAPEDDEDVEAASRGDEGSTVSGEPKKDVPSLLSLFAPLTEEKVEEERTLGKTVCGHRYHPACLESMERIAGRWNVQEDGKVYVRCARCRKDGWVTAPDAEVEEVERGLENA